MQRVPSSDERSTSLSTINEKQIEIESMQTNDKYIICSVRGFFSEKDKDLRQYSKAIFIFDWDLNPIKSMIYPIKKMAITLYLMIVNQCISVSLPRMD